MATKMLKLNKRLLVCGFCFLLAACSLPVFMNGCAGEACFKTMTVTGTVKDGTNSEPLNGVNVFCCTVGETTPKTTTGADGKYSFSTGNLGGFAGAKVRFEKSGYVTQSGSEFTEAEAGIDRCGNYTVTRDISISP